MRIWKTWKIPSEKTLFNPMECKNCNLSLHENDNYCNDCGAKVIRNRLTFKNLWEEFIEKFLNVDNTFLKTFTHLLTKPEVVIVGFIDGVRRKYMNPVNYIAIALTLTGILIFFMKKTFPEGIDFNQFGAQVYTAETSKKLTDFIFAFYSLISLLFIPVFAVSAFLSFNKKKFVFTEHIISFIYIQAQYSLFTFPITLLVLFLAPERYMQFSLFFILVMLLYALYVMKRMSGLKRGDFLLNSIIFIMLFSVGYFAISIFQFILLFLTGTLTLQDFVPQA